ncbi:TIGR01777 family protein [Marinobacter halodurans]|uniref:TIGR01777 family protein n=1 Tax=Marinobacter halodurans TaxID=2528979 RepID=A0ABY1ZRZ4_9GAMM|nr:TIGR01777 family oxidoreductase [Marinobacter halodurans]TBW59059.1 TIGR01777 family protein [Marinobacter halodurans]
MTQHILITGGTGFIGQRLCPELLKRGYRLTVFSRRTDDDVRARCGRVNTLHTLADLRNLDALDAVINLAGEGLASARWTEKRKRVLRESRIDLTRELIDQLEKSPLRPATFISGSAIGYYGSHGGEPVTEDAPVNDDFAHRLCADWEAEARRARQLGCRVCLSRTGVVLGPDGGMLERLLLPFRLGLGGRLGDGQQYLSWVHRDDVVNALIWMLQTPDASGAYNVVSPHPVTNRTFTRTLGRVLHRPTPFPVPAFVLRTALGELSAMLLEGQRVMPARLQQAGFGFTHPDLEDALRSIIGG